MSEVKTNKVTSLASNNDITLDPDGTGDVVVASGHNLGIGTTSPARQLTVSNSGAALLLLESTGDDNGQLLFGDSADGTIGKVGYAHSTNHLFFNTNGSEQMRITSDGDVGIGTSSPTLDSALAGLSVSSNSTLLQIHDSDGACVKLSDPASGANRGLGIALQGTSAVISNCESGELRFGTGNTERIRIDSSGHLLIGKTDTGTDDEGAVFGPGDLQSFTRNDQKVLRVRRNTSDGTIVEFFQAGNQEGTISVSGSTVSYNGGHLSRWSQATDGNRIDGLVKGTVMTNLDQMAVWTKDGVTEDNEQLNCMAVSTVEGDANVAGVFVNWDDDDEDYTADMNVAMTGDMVIRIAQGTTVARGDLLTSAGDGTAKPQGDDIVRSKTIAKVTSTTKSHTYDDGSYLVPCVLMAC